MLLKVGTRLGGHDEPLYLSRNDLKAHAHGIGASRAGKSKLIEFITRQLIKERQGVCVIDPSGFLYHELVQWLAYVRPNRDDIFLFNPSDEKKVVGFNPFHLDGLKTEAAITAKVDRILGATLKALGVSDTSNAPRMERIMRCLYYVLIEQDLSIAAIRYFLSPRHIHLRDEIISRIQSEDIKDQWLMLTANKRPEAYLNMMESTANRLFKFLTQQTVKRIIGTSENSLDVQKIVDNRGTLLVNLQASPTFSQESARIIGTLFVSELWETIRKRTREDLRKLPNFYLIVDEFQNFTTPDFPQMLDQSAKYGLHLVLFHQNLNQLDNDLKTALTACHTRFVFGGVTRLDAGYSLEGSTVPSDHNLQDYLAAVPSLPSRHYMLKRPDQQLALAYTPDVNEYRVPEDKVEKYVETVTARFLSPDQVDELMQSSLPVQEETPPPLERPAAVDFGELLTASSNPPKPQKQSQEERQPFTLNYERARGTLTHKDSQRQIAGVARDLHYKAQIEKPVLDGAGLVDVSIEKDDIKIACEVSITSSTAWETRNVTKCLQAGYNHVWVIAFPQHISRLTARIREAIPVIEQVKFKVLTLGDCFVELRRLAAPVDPNTGKPITLAGQSLTVPEAAEFFKVHESTIYRWKGEGRLPYSQIKGKGKILFDRDLLMLLNRHNLTGNSRTTVILDKPVKIEKPKTKNKKQQDDRYRKMLKLD